MRGLSQEGLAELAGVSRQAVSKWELNDALFWLLVDAAAIAGGLLIFFKGRAYVRKEYGLK